MGWSYAKKTGPSPMPTSANEELLEGVSLWRMPKVRQAALPIKFTAEPIRRLSV